MLVRMMGRRRHNHKSMMWGTTGGETQTHCKCLSSSSLYSYHDHPITTTRRRSHSSLVTETAATTTASSAVAFGRPGQRRQRQRLSFSSSSTTYNRTTSHNDDDHDDTTSNHHSHDSNHYSNRHDLLRQDTQHFLDPQTVLDTTDAELWRHADAILRGWLSFDLDSQHHVDTTTTTTTPLSSPLERVQVCLQILDRLAALLPQGEFLWVSSLLDRDILVHLLLLWKGGLRMDDEERRKVSSQRHNNNDNKEAQQAQSARLRRLLTPSFVASKLDQYRYASLIQPDASIFHILLETAACNQYFSHRHGMGFAHGLLLKLVQVTATTSSTLSSTDEEDDMSDGHTPPLLMDVVSVAIVMKGWIQHGQPHKAEEWLDRIESWQATTPTTKSSSSSSPLAQVRPNKILYTTVLSGWAQHGHAERAMTILHRQLEVYQTTGNSQCRPDTQTWNTGLGALAKSKHQNTNNNAGNWVVTQAQQLVDELMPSYECLPDDHTWTSLMSCYVKHKPSEAKKLLKQLETKHYYHHHDNNNNNNTTTTEIQAVPLPVYNAMLQMYAHHGNVQSAIALLERMEAAAAAASGPATAPDAISYNTVLAAYCKLKDPTAAFQAEAFWDGHADKFVPSIVTYGTLLECWAQHAKHSPKTAMDRMTAILHEMKEPPQGLSAAKAITPNTTCYNILLKTWAQLAGLPRNGGGGGGKQQQDPSERVSSDYCSERVLELFEEMANSSNTHTRPDDTTFRTILHAVIGSSSSRAKRQVILDYVLPKMKRLGFHPKGKNDEELLRRCLKASSPIRSSPSR